jgi:peptide/nickel transport system ATP-binding protein
MTAATPPLLQVRDLRVTLSTQRGPVDAVRGLSFHIARGQSLGLIGESGSGKSLTALALMGLLPDGARTAGQVLLHGANLLAHTEAQWCQVRGNRMGMIFQEPMTALNPVHPVGRQVGEPLRIHRGVSAAQARAQAIKLLDRVGIANAAQRVDAYPHQFSGGQRQRIGIAMALACEPDVLVADEPTTALDVTVQAQILALINELVAERGMGLLLISHDLGLMARHAQHLLVMYGGAVAESGPVAKVLQSPQHPYTQGLLAARPRLGAQAAQRGQRLRTIAGIVPDLHDLPRGCAFAGRCDFAVPSCHTDAPPQVLVHGQSSEPHHARCSRLDIVNTVAT